LTAPQDTVITAVALLSDAHRAYLNEHAIADAVTVAAGIWSDNDRIAFPWRDRDLLTVQRRQWPEPEGGLPEGEPKYRWEKDHPPHLWALRPIELMADGAPVIIAEGTKQSLAVASWAPGEYAVYGMPSCDIGLAAMLAQAGLDRFEDRRVIIMLDADAGDNLNVWEGGEKLAAALETEGAQPSFVPSPAQGTDGIDDYLARMPENRRTEKLAKLLAHSGARPAFRKPARRKMGDRLPDTGDRPVVVINKDRLDVIREILWHVKSRWSGSQLFCYGGALARLRDAGTEPLDKNALLRWLPEAVATFRYKPPGANSPGSYEACWPDPETIGALLASGDEFAPLVRVTRTPFARPDGTLALAAGYDPATSTVLIAGGGMDRLDIPDNPSQHEAAIAAKFLLDTWLGDMPFRSAASRAAALGLVLTPFIRGAVPLAPLAVISGSQQGVGKNLLADCISLMTAGTAAQTLPWLPDDDDEVRKQLTAAFRAGTDLVCFDEAHVIGGSALSRAITSLAYADRILGVSKQVSWPNQVTWMALGNQVQVNSDMARRAYWIELYPDCPDPENRPESAFAHPELREWTAANRAELTAAALVMIRAWHAAGRPCYQRGVLMGSFEAWDKMVSGILGYAGVDGFLGNLAERRAETDTAGQIWAGHLGWLAEAFGDGPFTAADAKLKAVTAGAMFDGPPGLTEPARGDFTQRLGTLWAHHQGRWHGDCRIVKLGTVYGTRVKWAVQTGRDQGEASPSSPSTPSRSDGLDGVDGVLYPTHDAREVLKTADDVKTHTRIEGGTGTPSSPSSPSDPVGAVPAASPPQPDPGHCVYYRSSAGEHCPHCGATSGHRS
jgi:hypothetical protein